MADVRVTIDIPEEHMQALREIAKNLDSDEATVIHNALAQYVEDYKQETLEAEEAMLEFEAGRTIPHEEIVRQFEDRVRKVQAA